MVILYLSYLYYIKLYYIYCNYKVLKNKEYYIKPIKKYKNSLLLIIYIWYIIYEKKKKKRRVRVRIKGQDQAKVKVKLELKLGLGLRLKIQLNLQFLIFFLNLKSNDSIITLIVIKLFILQLNLIKTLYTLYVILNKSIRKKEYYLQYLQYFLI